MNMLKLAGYAVAAYAVWKIFQYLNYGYFSGVFMWTLVAFFAIFIPLKLANKSSVSEGSGKGQGPGSTDADYFHSYGGTTIAVNQQDKTIALTEKKISKTYSFSDVRSWETNIQSGGQIIGGGLAVLSANISNARGNSGNTGLFIKMRDVDHPVWHIKFKANGSLKKELARWMEIMQQTVNEN